jgi:hypothetical protein
VLRTHKSEWLFRGAVALGTVAVGGWVLMRDSGDAQPDVADSVIRQAADPPKTCAALGTAAPGTYAPIRVGPISFDPGPGVASGTDIRYLGKTNDGYIIKSFIAVERFSSGRLRLTGTNLATGAALTFDYPQEPPGDGYRAEMVFPADQMDRISLRPPVDQPAPAYWAAPGAWAAPELGLYEVRVEDDDGHRWATTISICRPLPSSGPG